MRRVGAFLLAGLFAASLAHAATPPEPTPAPVRLIAALETEQGLGWERTALFDDGTLVHVTRYRGRTISNRRLVTTNERDVVRKICEEALEIAGESRFASPLAPQEGGRKVRLEIVDARGKTRLFEADDLAPMPLLLGRARGALEDLRSRFYKRDEPEDPDWDPAGVATGDVLRMRNDKTWFRVIRDDTFQPNLELTEIGGKGRRLIVPRQGISVIFSNPARLPSDVEVPK